MNNHNSNTILNSSEESYLTLVQSYMNISRDILNGYMTFENGLSRQIFRTATRTTAAAAAADAAATQSTQSNLETPVMNFIRREAQVPPDTPIRPTLQFRSNVSPPPSSPFQMPTPVRLTSRLEEEEPPRFTLPRRIGSLSQLRQPQTHDENSSPNQNVVTAPTPTPPFASSFVRYRLPVPLGPPRRVPAVPLPVPVTDEVRTPVLPVSSPPQSPPIYTGRTWQELRRQQLQRQQLQRQEQERQEQRQQEQRQQEQRQQEQRQQEQERERQEREQEQQEQLNSLSPILPVEPTSLPPLTTATRMMLNLLDTPRFNDSLVYYTQVINREFGQQGQRRRFLNYDIIQQQTKIIPYCTVSNPLNDICPISQIPFDLVDSVMQINICKHNFNPYSLIRWFDTNSTCPMCRQEINENTDAEGDDNDNGNNGNRGNGRSNAIRMYNNENNLYHDDSDFSSVG